MNSFLSDNQTASPNAIQSPPKDNFGGFNTAAGFAGDERNMGGRKIILDHFSRH
jgi:hypothetical protein